LTTVTSWDAEALKLMDEETHDWKLTESEISHTREIRDVAPIRAECLKHDLTRSYAGWAKKRIV